MIVNFQSSDWTDVAVKGAQACVVSSSPLDYSEFIPYKLLLITQNVKIQTVFLLMSACIQNCSSEEVYLSSSGVHLTHSFKAAWESYLFIWVASATTASN